MPTRHTPYYCAYGGEALLRMSDGTGKLHFLHHDAFNNARALFGVSKPGPESRKVTIHREVNNWYELVGTGVFPQTSICIELARYDDGLLEVSSGGFDELQFLKLQCGRYLRGVDTLTQWSP